MSFYDNFNLIKYFNDKNIQWWPEQHANVSPGWIGTPCLFCNDHLNHLGINLQSKKYSCWLCKAKGDMQELVMAIESCDEEDAMAIINEYREDGLNDQPSIVLPTNTAVSQRNRPSTGSILPSTIVTKWPTTHLSYLYKRGFKPVKKYINKYNLLPVYTAGIYRWRIVIPMFLRNKLVNFTARDITDRTEVRYRHCPNRLAIVPRRELLYNIDNATGRNLIVVEGPTDVWRIGDGAVASMGTEVTNQQIDLIRQKGFENIYLLFDKEAEKIAERVANRLAFVVNRIEILNLIDEEDPGSMSEQTTQQIRQILRTG